jgi:hypothetical protein
MMNDMNQMTRNAEEPALSGVGSSELGGITGGIILVADGYCASPLLPRHLPLVAVQNQELSGAIAAGSH